MVNAQPPVMRPWNPNNTNEAIVTAIALESSSDFQRRIPDAIKGDVKATLNAINNYTPAWNEFVDALVNKIGLPIARNESWSNPLARYKKGLVENGDTVEELQMGLIEGYAFDPRREYGEKANFGQFKAEVASSYHTLNRESQYIVTVQRPTLQRAFTSDTGLSDFIMGLMATANTSDNWDEYLLMVSLLHKYEESGGFFKVHVDDIANPNSSEAESRSTLRTLREYAETLPFLSRNYNAAKMPVHADPDKLILICTPQFKSGLDVNALATLFNVSYADVPYRTHVIPREDMSINGTDAILTTEDFFQVYDTYFATDSMPNPAGRSQNYFLNHDQIISASRFVPAIAFTTGEGDVINIPVTPVTDVDTIVVTNTLGTTVTELERGESYIVTTKATTMGDNTAVMLNMTGDSSQRSYLSQTGTLHIAIDEDATSVTVEARSEDDVSKVRTAVYSIVGEKVQFWPNPELSTDTDADGLLEVTPKAPTFAGNKITVPKSNTVAYIEGLLNENLRDGALVVNGTTITVTAGTKTITATAEDGYELKPGAVASWTFTFTP